MFVILTYGMTLIFNEKEESLRKMGVYSQLNELIVKVEV